jgi:hypothetical protein
MNDLIKDVRSGISRLDDAILDFYEISMHHPILARVSVTTIAALAGLVLACAQNPPARTTTAGIASPQAMPPDTKAEPGNCNFYNYYHDESKNSGGPGRCATDCDCDGMRTCASGNCSGEARAQVDCNSPNRHWNEAWNPQGAGKCASDCDCDGRRTCQAGTCQGVAR